VPSEIACAFLYAQLEMMETIADRRREIYKRYRSLLKPLEIQGQVGLPHIPEDSVSNYHMFYILLPDMSIRDALMEHLREVGIGAVFHFVPLHTSPMGRRFGQDSGQLPVTEEVSGRLLRLPFFYNITEEEQVQVVDVINQFFHQQVQTSSSMALSMPFRN
jgi:dTDP-4-amino-4,6-dideoxygalactose transaminase